MTDLARPLVHGHRPAGALRAGSSHLSGLALSDIRRMTRECDRVGGINLGQGVCDLPTPDVVREGAVAAIQADRSIYSYAEGIAPLREAIAEKVERDNGISADPGSQIVVTLGATGAFVSTITALLERGDGILILEPYYSYHVKAAQVAGLEPQFLVLDEPDFSVRADALRGAVRESTRAIVLCTPCNPSGKMLDSADLQAIRDVAVERDLLVITDEIYEYIRFDGRSHVSPASFQDLSERTVSIMGLSKTFSITGWRLGYAIAPAPMARSIALVNDLFYICAPTPLQHAVLEGFKLPRSFFEELQAEYQAKRDLLCGALDAASLNPVVPQGAYYVMADVSPLGYGDAFDAAMALLEGCGVASVPGTSFYTGEEGNRFLRFCFATDRAVLEEACRRIESFRRH